MKKVLSLILLTSFMTVAFAQDEAAGEVEQIWKKGGFSQLNLNQVALVNWAAGGENSIALTFIGNGFANYKKDKWAWDNSLDFVYGLVRSQSIGVRKSDDRLEINSKGGYKIAEKWYVASLLNFKTQVANGWEYPEGKDNLLVSKFAAPAYLSLGLGFDFKPSDVFSLYISPATGRFTIVREDDIIDETRYGLDAGETFRQEFGAYLSAKLVKEVVKNVELSSKLDLFNNYTNGDTDFYGKSKRWNIDVDWQTSINMKVNEYITASILMHLIYDDDIKIDIVDDETGESTGRVGPRTQFKESLGVGFSYKF